MTWDDKRINRAFAALDPARTDTREGASLRGQSALQGILSTPTAPRFVTERPRRRVASWRLARPLAAMFVLIAVLALVVPVTMMPSRAVVSTPPRLALQNANVSLQEVVDMSISELAADSGLAMPARGSRSIGWYLDATVTADGESSVIAPQERIVQWGEDLSGKVTLVAGTPYVAGDDADSVPAGSAAEPGTILSELSSEAGEFYVPAPEPPPSDLAGMRDFLGEFGYPMEPLRAGDVVLAVDSAFQFWTLTNAQHAAILQLIEQAGDAEVAGTGVDRMGRAVIALKVTNPHVEGTDFLLLISSDTGRIVGIETILTKPTTKPALPAGAVVAYTLWETK